MIDVKSFATARRFDPAKMQKVALFESDGFFCDVYCLLPGQEQKPHAHEGEDKIYYVVSGEVVFRDGTKEVPGKPGDVLWARAGEEHGVRNDATGRATLLVYMAPHPRAEKFPAT